MRYSLVTASLLALVTACGPSEDPDTARLQGLRVQAAPYINYMFDGCYRIITRFTIRAGPRGFPVATRAVRVTLTKSDGTEWTEFTAALETGFRDAYISEENWLGAEIYPNGGAPSGVFPETVLYGIARGCGPWSIRERDVVRVAVVVEASAGVAEVATTAQVGGAH